MRLSRSDYYRNELDIEYRPSAALRLAADYGLVKYIPHQVRYSLVSLLPTARRRSRDDSRRRTFPIDDLADRLSPSIEQKREFWQKDFGVIMTHDVDTRYGYECGLSRFLEMEKTEDVFSTLNLVPSSSEYKVDPELVTSLVREGFDIGMHGLHHDGKFAFLPAEKQRERILGSGKRAKDLGLPSMGYRAPLLHRTKGMIRYLTEAGFDWDSSFPDTDDSTEGYSPTGCRTVFPFYPLYKGDGEWKQSPLLEIPVSMPQDWTLLYYYRLSEESILRVLRKKMNYIKSRGGLATFLLHPDQEDFGHPSRHRAFKSLLRTIKDADPEMLTCSELALRWRKRFPVPRQNA